MTTALYRRYRPDTFQDVIGQDHVTAPLMAALRADRVTHAYLFSGPRGCGKTTSARILARCLNCEQAPTDAPCGECASCRDLATGGPGSLDVVEIDAASHNGVDDARDLRERAAFAPARDRYKVFILDEAHMVTAQGFNALLKLVEEPPAHVKFIFATTEPDKVIGTIRSRTHHYPFRLVPPDVLESYLGQLCGAEGVSVGPGVFPLVVRAGGGSVRDTLSVMDQLIGGAVDGSVDYQRAVALLGYTDTTLLDQCVDAVAAADGSGVFRVVERVVTSGHDPRRFVEDLLQRLRDLLVIALAGSEAGPALGSLPSDQLARMEAQARTLGAAALSRAADTTAQALGSMVGATSPRLQLELLMARLLLPGSVPGGLPGAAPGAQVPAAGGQAPAVGHPLSASAPGASAPTAFPVPPAPTAPPSASGPTAPAAAVPLADQGAQTSPGALPGATAPLSPSPQPQAGPSRTTAQRPSAQHPPQTATTPQPSSRPSSPSASQSSPTRPDDGQGAPGAAEAEMIRTRWEEVLEAAKRSRRATWALVGPNSQPGSLREGVLTLLFTAPGLVGAFENGGHGPVLSAAIHQALGLQVDVHAVLVGGDGPGEGGPGGGSPGSHWNGAQAGPGGPQAGAGGGALVAWDRSQTGATGSVASRDQGGIQDVGGQEEQEPPPPPEEPPEWLPEPSGQGRGTAAAADGAREEPAPASEGTRGEVYAGSAGVWAPGPGASVPDPDDGWGPVAVPGGGGAVHPVPEPTEPVQPPASQAPAGEGTPPPASSPLSPPPSASASPASSASPPEPPLAPVRRLHALPDLPAAASPGLSGPGTSATSADASDQGGEKPSRPLGLAPVTWDGPEQAAQTFSDGVPLPEEPGDPEGAGAEGAVAEHDGAGGTWAPTGAAGSRLAAAMAAARAAAQEPDDHSALAEDTPSEDDEDAEDAGVVGLEVVKRVLGATVIEEVTVTQEGY